MYCSNCGAKLSKTVRFCPDCGAKNSSHPQTTTNEATTPTSANLSNFQYKPPIPHTTTPLKFFLLTTITLGLYVGYWGWRNWEIVKRTRNLSVSPTWRGIFIAFTAAPLFNHVQSVAKEKGHPHNFSATSNGLAVFIILFILNGLGRIDEIEFWPYLGIAIAAFGLITMAVTPVINAMNYFLEQATDIQPRLNFGANVPLIMFYVVITAFVFIASFYLETASMETSGEYERIFTESCIESGGNQAYCGCMYQQLTSRYSITEISRMGLLDEEIPGINLMADTCLDQIT